MDFHSPYYINNVPNQFQDATIYGVESAISASIITRENATEDKTFLSGIPWWGWIIILIVFLIILFPILKVIGWIIKDETLATDYLKIFTLSEY